MEVLHVAGLVLVQMKLFKSTVTLYQRNYIFVHYTTYSSLLLPFRLPPLHDRLTEGPAVWSAAIGFKEMAAIGVSSSETKL